MTTQRKRRHYTFRSREEAEQAYRDSERTSQLYFRVLYNLYFNQVEWIPSIHNSPYKIGICDHDSPGGPKVLMVYGANPGSLHVQDAYDFIDKQNAARAYWQSSDRERELLYELAQEIKYRLDRYYQQNSRTN